MTINLLLSLSVQIIVHPNPAKTFEEAAANMVKNCPTWQYPWEQYGSAMWQSIPYLSEYFKKGLDNVISEHTEKKSIYEHKISSKKFDNISNPHIADAFAQSHYPFVPDVLIHIRCSDTLDCYAAIGAYGFISWSVYEKFIPKDVKYIYIMSPELLSNGRHGAACVRIVDAFVKFLNKRFPDAVIGIIHNAFLEMLLLYVTEHAFCPPSTFCNWPALARTNGTMHMFQNFMMHGSPENPLNPTIHWMTRPPILQFGAFYEGFSSPEHTQAIIDQLSEPYDGPYL